MRAPVLVGLLLLGLVALAKFHACACTGGPPQWRSVYPTSEPSGQG